MQNVFITGATGYIGFEVAQAFRRAGYAVWGLTRSEANAKMLAQQEIRPVIGSMQQPDSYLPTARRADVLIHAAVDYQSDTAELDAQTVDRLLDAATPNATFIYTSGVWVHGNTNGTPVDESAPLLPAQAVAWRPQVEQRVLQAENVRGIVIRPGVVYGKQGGLTAPWFEGASHGAIQIVGDGTNRWAMVHVADLARGYVLAAESGLRGEAFNLVATVHATVREMAASVAQHVGQRVQIQTVPSADASQTMGAMAEALALNQEIRAEKAARLLRWQPTRAPFTADVDTYFTAWQAHAA